ncbi:MAG: hypothetical protein MRZ79_15410 [Bacteroidia bacterium]|nr:hypothetical protein [Bacteroidia bacterium]
MFIPQRKHLTPQVNGDLTNKLKLKSQHLVIHRQVLNKWEGEIDNVFFCYYPKRKQLFLAPVSHAFFPKLHEANQAFLKTKNLQGDKSMPLHEILMDEELDTSDRILEFEFMEKHGILKIYI